MIDRQAGSLPPRFNPLKLSTFQHVEKFSTVELLNFLFFLFLFSILYYIITVESTPEK